MKLYLMRHAEAEDGERLDPTRGLTDTGKRQAKMMGQWLNRQADRPELVVESNMRRSIQTAKRVAKRLDVYRLRTYAIDPDGEPRKALKTLKRLTEDNVVTSVLAVTHGPLVEQISAYLTGSDPDQIKFAHGAIAYFGDDGRVRWFVTPEIVARDAGEADEVTADALGVAEAALAMAVGSI